MRNLFLTFSLSLLTTVVFGQKYSFVAYSTAEGLPQSQVTAITQDDKGYLWVGTIGGLTKFNGETFAHTTTREGLLNNRITSLDFFEETLWVGHDGGITTIIDGKITSYIFTGDDKSRPVDQILRYKGAILVCSNGGGLFKLNEGNLERIEIEMLKSNKVRSAHIYQNVLYLATKDGIMSTTDLKSFKMHEEFGDYSFSEIFGDDQELITTTFDSLIVRKNLKTGVVTETNPDGIEGMRGGRLAEDRSLWIWGKKGTVNIKPDGTIHAFNRSSGLPLEGLTCVFEDQNKNIWIGSEGKGLFRFPGMRFQYFDKKSGYLSDLFTCGFERENGDRYYGTYDSGILFKEKGKEVRAIDIPGLESVVWCAIPDIDGKQWLGRDDALVSIDANGEPTVFTKADTPELPGSKISSFEKIDNNSMYVGGNDGVSLYRNGVFTKVGTRNKEYLGTVRDIAVVKGKLYCVTNLGMFVYRNNDFYPIRSGMGRVNYNMAVDESERIWVGSGAGLFIYENGEMTQLRLLDDDPRANFINFINYKDAKLFVGTNNGLLIVTEENKGEFKVKHYGPGDGIPDIETNLNSGFFDKDGIFWFGSSYGLVKFDERTKGIGIQPPILNLKSILLNFEKFDYSKYCEEILPNGYPKLLVFPYHKNNLVFEFDGVALVNHKELKYQFKLKGLNDSWSPLTTFASITYSNLSAGEYELMVRAVDLDGRQSEITTLPFVINEAYYKTWWFITLCMLLSGALVLLIFRIRLRRIREVNENEMIAYKSRLVSLEQKSLNASMNRHFIFNSLNSIQYFINTRDRLSANKYLTNFAKLIRKNLDSASSVDNRITLEDELSRIELYLSLESMRFKDRFEYVITTNDIDLEMYQIPAMLLQPFIENSIIHGILPQEEVKGLIEVNLELKNDILEILIRDNGIGVNQSMSRKTVDTGDHRSQGMEITSKRIELMQKFSDEAMELIGPKELVGEDGSINGTYVLLKLEPQNLED